MHICPTTYLQEGRQGVQVQAQVQQFAQHAVDEVPGRLRAGHAGLGCRCQEVGMHLLDLLHAVCSPEALQDLIPVTGPCLSLSISYKINASSS